MRSLEPLQCQVLVLSTVYSIGSLHIGSQNYHRPETLIATHTARVVEFYKSSF